MDLFSGLHLGPELGPCPTDGRRGFKQIWMNLFVVHLTTIASFCHVLSLQRERILTWKLAIYLLMPSTLFLYHGLVVILYSITFISWALFSRSEQFGNSLKRAPRIFFGSAPMQTELPKSEPRVEDEEPEYWLKVGGRFLLACAFLAQCSGTIALFARRERHDAVTYADKRILEAACTGILTAIYWIGITTRVPLFAQPAPIESEDTRTHLDALFLLLRGHYVTPLPAWTQHALIRYLGNYYLLLSALVIKCIYIIGCSPPAGAGLVRYLASELLPNKFRQSGAAVGMVWMTGVFEDRASSARRSWFDFLFGKCCAVMLLLLALRQTEVLYYIWAEWYQIAEQISVLEASPTTKPCPLLWSDPAANWIWSLV